MQKRKKSSAAPSAVPSVRLQINAPDKPQPLLDVSVVGTKVVFAPPPRGWTETCSPGCTVTLTINGKKPATMKWTVESFAHPLQQTLDYEDEICEIQFHQRCLLTDAGFVTWRLHLCNVAKGNCKTGSPLSYNLTSYKDFVGAKDKELIPVPLDGTSIEFKILNDQNAPDNVQNFNFMSDRVHREIYAAIEPSSSDDLCYRVGDWRPAEKSLAVGNGIDVSKDRDYVLWQSCTYTIDSSRNHRLLKAGVHGITTRDILENWNGNVVGRYYEGLAVDKLFSFVPELTAADGDAHLWTVQFHLTDTYRSYTSKPASWFVEDADPQERKSASTPPECIVSRVGHVGMNEKNEKDKTNLPLLVVAATMPHFRTQDGDPVRLQGLTLKTAPLKSLTKPAWGLILSGKGPGKGKQVVRSGAFELHLPIESEGSESFVLTCNADYGRTSGLSSSFTPQIDLTVLPPLPLLDVVPAAEDELDADVYAQANQQIIHPDTPRSAAEGEPSDLEVQDAALSEISSNMRREPPLVFRNPASTGTPAERKWHLRYTEQALPEKRQTVTMQLSFIPTAGKPASEQDDSVLVVDRVPFTFAEVHFRPLKESGGGGANDVAEWNSQNASWKILQDVDKPSYLVLPSQITGEEAVTSDAGDNYPVGVDDGKQPKMLLGTPAIVTYAPDTQRNFAEVPWNLRRLLTNSSLHVSRLDYEMLYGLACNTAAPQMRLTEAATLYGDIRQGLPDNPQGYKPGSSTDQYLNARLHWSRVYREYQSRLGIFVVEDPSNTKDPSDFHDTTNTECQLRLDDADPNYYDDPRIKNYITPSEVSHDFTRPNFKGGALVGVNNAEIFAGIVRNDLSDRKSGRTHAAVINPRFSALGAFGTTQARFDNDRSTLINTVFMGRTVTYSVERIGRIACHWNRAKHVIVYERTVVPSRQFYLSQKHSNGFRGIPLLRKVEEYVEFLQTERVFATEASAPQAAFAKGFKCGEKKRIPVDSAWGSTVPGQGWKVPLWNPAAAAVLPDVYPKPELYLEVSTPEKAQDSTATQPKFLTRDCLLACPQEVMFFTSTVPNANANTDSWPAVDIDRGCYPLLVADGTIYKDGNLQAVPLPELSIPPGWEPVSFTIEAPATGIHCTDGIITTQTPVSSKLKTVTVSRGAPPVTATISDLLKANAPALSAYVDTAKNVADFSQKIAEIRKAISDPNAVQAIGSITQQVKDISTTSTTLAGKVTNSISDLSSSIQGSINAAGDKLKTAIQSEAKNATDKLNALSKALDDPAGILPGNPWKVEAGRIVDLIQSTQAEVMTWTETDPAKLKLALNGAMQSWSAELEQAIGSFSPLLKIAMAVSEFQLVIKQIHDHLNALINSTTLTGQQLLSEVQRFADQYDSSVRHLMGSVSHLQATVPTFDAATVLTSLGLQALSSQFIAAVNAAVEAAAASSEASADAALKQARALLKEAQEAADSVAKNLQAVAKGFVTEQFDLLRQSSVVKGLYASAATLQGLQQALTKVKTSDLLDDLKTNITAYIGTIQDNSTNALKLLASLFNADSAWVKKQLPDISASWKNLQDALGKLDPTGAAEAYLQSLQKLLNDQAGKIQNAVDSTKDTIGQYVRGPLMERYQAVAGDAGNVMRVVRAFGDAPQVPHLDIQPAAVAFVYDYVNQKIPITPVLARANQVGQALNALGVNLPSVELAESLVPAELKNFNLNQILANFSGLNLSGLFSGIKLPEIANKNVVITHGWDPQARRGWLQADVNVPMSDRMVVFQVGVFAFCLSNAVFDAHCKIQNDGARVQQLTNGSISGKWSIELSESTAIIEFADTALVFDDSGKLQFKFNPAKITLSDALKAISQLVKTLSDPDSGFTYGATANGVKCAFALPIPDTSGLTSGITGLTLATSLELSYTTTFDITLSLGVSSKNRPFNFAIFILGGCGYLEASVTYHVGGALDPPQIELAIGCSASLAISLGPISGGVYAQFLIELQQHRGGLRAGAFFQVTGHVSLLGIVSIDIVLRLEATYSDNVMTATGYVSYEVKMFMFSIAVHCSVSMRLGSSGQSSSLLELREPPGNELAGLAGPDGFTPGLAAAFIAAEQAHLTFAQRYIRMLV